MEASANRDCVEPPLAGGTIPGGFFQWPDECASPWRWDPLATRDVSGKPHGRWVAWPLAEPSEDTPSRLRRILRALCFREEAKEEADAANEPKTPKQDGKQEEGDHETAAKAAAEMYRGAVEKYRDGLKWLVVTAGAVAVAAVGTAPLSGFPEAIPGPGGFIATLGFAILVVFLTLILVFVSRLTRPAGTNTVELGSSPKEKKWHEEKKWLASMQEQYAGAPTIFLDGKARDLTEYRDYRAGWLGVAADIDRSLLKEANFARSEKLGKYRDLANAQLRADDDSTAANLQRGLIRIVQRRIFLGTIYVIAFAIIATTGFVVYLLGIGIASRPSVDELTATPSQPAIGQSVVISATTSGDKLSFTWTHNNSPITPDDADFYGADGPLLRIATVDAADGGTYMLTVTDGEGQTSSQSIQLPIAS